MLKTKSTKHSRNRHHKLDLHIDYDAHKLQSWTSSQGRIQNRKLFNYIESNDKGKSICGKGMPKKLFYLTLCNILVKLYQSLTLLKDPFFPCTASTAQELPPYNT
ncbi:hypothetical protein TorRG33x02_158720 [Trema orientale]|uniref:Uncharacterized protein n=1 Tax=Trema orientale TaxID=63057 RepID=A0A2P5ES25_TREOI|nr:hypothetical protein TorRG33x02_158720 [Trema orientale]